MSNAYFLDSNELHTFKCLKPACAEQTMRLLGSPVFPLKNRYVSDSPFKKLICQNESFVTWQKARGPSILHVYAPLNSIEVSEYISQSCMMENPTDVVLYFNIDPHDCQRNTAMSILQSWLSQIWPNSCELIQASSTACFLQRSMCLSSSWTLLDLVTSFRTILWSFSTKFIAITCVVRGLDECDDQLDFIQLFRDFAAETEDKYKLVSVTASHDAFQNALSDCLTIDLSSQILDKTGTEAEIHQELLALTDEVPELSTFQNTVIEKLRLCGNDVSRRTLLLNEFRLLKNCTIGFDVGRELNGNQASSLDYTILRILKRIPIQRQKWARRTIALILYAVRPLSIWELPILLYLEFDNPNCPPNNFVHISFDDVVSEIQTAFGGMIIVEHNMFRFLTPEIRSFFQPTDGSAVLWYHVMEEVAHEEVFDSLCGYLLLTQTHKYLQVSREDVDGFAQMPEMAGKYDLDQYAVTYWPHHYSLIPIEKRKDNTVEYHFRIRRIIRSWSSAYWRFDNPITRRNRSFISDLPLLAHLGFLELVIQQLHESRHTSRDITLATTEAARVGNVSIVRELVLLAKSDKACQTDLDDMLHAAVSSGKEQVILVVLDYIGRNIVGSELPPDVMIRAAQLGHTKILTKLFESGATQRPYREAEQEKAEPLYVAALSGQVEAVNILLSQKPDLEAISGKMGRNALHVASVNGHGEVVKLLLAAGSDIEALDIQSQPALSLASYFSSYAVIEELASFGCRMEGCLLSDGTKLSHPLATMATHAYFKSAEALLRHGAKTEGPELGFCTPLQCAMSESNLEFCQLLLSHGANPNNAGFGDPIMGIAAGNGDFEIVKLLIEKGADVDAVSELGWTALHKAAENDRREVQTYLLDRGADVDIQSQSGHTAISLAVSNNHPEVVKQLIDRGANVHLASTNGWSPIQLAYDSGEITRLLMEAGADGRRATNDLTPLYFAASRNSTETVQALIVAGVDLEQEQVNDTHNTALTIAVKNGHVDSARALLEAGANINHRSDRQNFPLQYAVIYDLRSMVRLLLEFGASTELVDQDGDTALCIVEKTSLEVVKMLANIGANLDSRNKLNETTLCKAVDLRKVEMVKYLISRKVNVNVTGGPRGGPIHIACYLPHLEMVKMLIAAGADCNLLDPRCGTPLQILCLYWYEANTKEEREEIAHYLLEDCHADVGVVGGEQGCALNAACGFASLGIVRLMLEKGAKVDVQDSTGRVAIHFAAMQAFSYIQAVMTAGASIEAVDKTGRTVLHWAVSSASLEVVERVFGLASHALNQPDIDGWTPLLWACRGGGTYMKAVTPDVQLSIIKFLLDQGADPSIRAQGLDREWSALQIARYHGMDDETIQLLTTRTKKKLKEASKPWVEAEYAQRAATQPRTGWCDSCYGVSHLRTLIFTTDLNSERLTIACLRFVLVSHTIVALARISTCATNVTSPKTSYMESIMYLRYVE